MSQSTSTQAVETWTVRKPVVESERGLVASQHHLASRAGARVLAAGGNAVDAAVTAGLAIGALEPWMSGLGGGGYMLVYRARERDVQVVEFPMRSPGALDPTDYPMVAGVDHDLFGWPSVEGDRNVHGPHSFAVPGFVAGHALALERFGTIGWREALEPAIAFARCGLTADWFATLKIAAAAPTLTRYPESARVYLPDGFVPAGEWGGPLPNLALGRLGWTLERLAEAGPMDFYCGEVARALVQDTREAGGCIREQDLAGYSARVVPAPSRRYRGATVHAATGLTAGPSLHRAFELLEARLPAPGARPGPDAFAAYAGALMDAYAERLERIGDEGDASRETCTTHLSVVDAEGNMVALTQTLLSVFGSKVVLPRTGILMNNGIMWFDPRPGRPNSIAPAKTPLSNMCPTMVEGEDGLRAALGASGGRRIMSAVFQIAAFLLDHGMSLDDAIHHPRIDVSGTEVVGLDPLLADEVRTRLARAFATDEHQSAVYPVRYACPNVVARGARTARNAGGAFVMSPWAAVAEG
jgi:gamma-glutamyltranspeptidase/glutathione hydrolase